MANAQLHTLPPLPETGKDLILALFTRKEDFRDIDRLSELGNGILETAVTVCLFQRNPFYPVGDIVVSKYSCDGRTGLLIHSTKATPERIL